MTSESNQDQKSAPGYGPELFKAIFDHSFDTISVLNRDGTRRWTSPSIERALGYKPEDLIGKSPFDLVHPEDAPALLKLFAEGLTRPGRTASRECRIRHRDGSWRILEATGCNLLDDPTVAGIVINTRDITKRKEAEDALRKAHAELEKRVQERTSQLSKANLELQRQIANRKRVEQQIKHSLKRERLLRREIHHRVKNNLQLISSIFFLQSLLISDQDMLKIFEENQNRVRAIALVYESLHQHAGLEKIPFADYLNMLIRGLLHNSKAGRNEIKFEIDAEPVLLDIDTAIPCGLIINELTSNSLKYAFPPSKEGEIRVRFHSTRDGKLNLVFSDNGVGLPKGFDLQESRTLGLKLVTDLTRQLGGSVEFERNGGTTVRITFVEGKGSERRIGSEDGGF